MFQCYVHRLAAEYFCVGDEHPWAAALLVWKKQDAKVLTLGTCLASWLQVQEMSCQILGLSTAAHPPCHRQCDHPMILEWIERCCRSWCLAQKASEGTQGTPRPGVCKKGETFQTSSCRNPPMYSDIWPPALNPTYFGRFAVSFWIVFTLVGGKKAGPFDPMMLLQSLGSLA